MSPRRDYRPSRAPLASAIQHIREDFEAGRLTADEVLVRYAAVVYHQTNSYEENTRRIGIDRRTVKAKVDRALLAQL